MYLVAGEQAEPNPESEREESAIYPAQRFRVEGKTQSNVFPHCTAVAAVRETCFIHQRGTCAAIYEYSYWRGEVTSFGIEPLLTLLTLLRGKIGDMMRFNGRCRLAGPGLGNRKACAWLPSLRFPSCPPGHLQSTICESIDDCGISLANIFCALDAQKIVDKMLNDSSQYMMMTMQQLTVCQSSGPF